jgi:hypothetical protein
MDVEFEIKLYKLLINFYPKNIIIETFSLFLYLALQDSLNQYELNHKISKCNYKVLDMLYWTNSVKILTWMMV